MSEVFHERIHVDDLRPISTTELTSCSYRCQMTVSLEINEKDECIPLVPRRVVDTPKLLWLRSPRQPPAEGCKICGCVGCEDQTWQDHILNEDADGEVSSCSNLHLEYVQQNADAKKDTEQNESLSSSEEDEEQQQQNKIDDCDETYASSARSLSPFPCGDPFEPYDLEC